MRSAEVDTVIAARLAIGLGLTVLTLVFAGRRVWWLYALIRSGQPAPGRTDHLAERLRAQLVEVFGQRRLLKWTIPGLAHFFTFWGFVILISVYVEAYGALFSENFAIPVIAHWPVLGFGQDVIALAVLVSIITFAVLPLIFWATMIFRQKVRDSYRRIRVAIARINYHLQEHLTGMTVLQLFNREKRAYKKFEEVNAQHMEAFKDAILAHAIYYPVVEVLSSIAIAAVIWFGGGRLPQCALITRLRPRGFASYSAVSTRESVESIVSDPRCSATPIDTVTWCCGGKAENA